MPMFNADTFMQQTVDQPLETEWTLVPEGEYQATIDDFTAEAIEQIAFNYKQGPKAGTPGVMSKFTIPFVIQDDAVKQAMGRDKVVVTKQVILDINDQTGGLDWGKNKNIELGRVRQGAGQNVPGPWSVAQLRGAGPMMVKVTHSQFDRKDGSKGTRVEVDKVARIS